MERQYAAMCRGEEEDFVNVHPVDNKNNKPTKALLLVCVTSALSAACQGMDETVINGAQEFFIPQFDIKNKPALIGLVNGAPYLCCAVLGCFLSIPLNYRCGRRLSIFFASAATVVSCITQALINNWYSMFAARLLLGLGIGVNSATVPMFLAETSPPEIRGMLGMLWQFFTAFGIMVGYATSLAFLNVDSNWRFMMGSPAVIALCIMALIYFCEESPRWLIGKGRHVEAYAAMCHLRRSKASAARDCFAVWTEEKPSAPLSDMFTRKNRRILVATELVMFTQQFCGINLIAYYSTMILRDANFTQIAALGASLGLGAANFLFAIPAFFIIDRFGRRPLLLSTLPLMSVLLVLTGVAYSVTIAESSRIAFVMTTLVLYTIAYSPGPGPVPFPYCAEAWPNALRPAGMAINTATTWGFNFLLSFTFPQLRDSITTPGVFYYYGGWCFVLTVLVFIFVRETRKVPLEQMDSVFEPTMWQFLRRKRRQSVEVQEVSVVVK